MLSNHRRHTLVIFYISCKFFYKTRLSLRREYETTSITIRETKLLKKGIVKTNANLLTM
jgi:hypothetical protein